MDSTEDVHSEGVKSELSVEKDSNCDKLEGEIF